MLLKILFILLIIFYLAIALCLFNEWQELMQKDVNSQPHKLFSKLLLLVITIFWPFVVPLAYLELLLKNKKNQAVIGLIVNQVMEDRASS